ncbi:MAG: protein kinase [Anaerolineae bacterium]|nr:protein kinase [Anaerolineae bacterium]MDW8298882.1 protein kinase [Anaerolineae bacterium]
MKRYCPKSETITPMFSVWGSARISEAGELSVIFDYGDYLGDIEIVRLMRVMKTSALYEARRKIKNKPEPILIKVAHNGCEDMLKREAVLMAKLSEKGGHPMLPVLQAPYLLGSSEAKQRPYGKVAFGDETKYYIVYAHAEGEFLRDVLLKNPQPWYLHAAWLTISLADVVAFIHYKAQHLVLNLSPDTVLIRYDRDGIPRPLLMDLSLAAPPDRIDFDQLERYSMAAYIAPELLIDREKGQYGAQTDVYGLGVLLYEMLKGRPPYAYRLRRPEDVRQEVRTQPIPPLDRTDLSAEINMIVTQAIDKSPTRRHKDVRTFAKELRKRFGEVPAERRRWRIPLPPQMVAAGVAVILLLVAWVFFTAVLQAGVI